MGFMLQAHSQITKQLIQIQSPYKHASKQLKLATAIVAIVEREKNRKNKRNNCKAMNCVNK